MSDPFPIGRRTFLRWLATGTSLFALPARVVLGQTNDRGIGGTGAPGAVEDENNDRGIGGTGVIGTIRRFGSIFVNGLRITYPRNVVVRIDGQRARTSQLKIGQVVSVIARRHSKIYSTHAINVTSEVIGTIDRVSGRYFVVLGQTVSGVHLAGKFRWRPGDQVAVSGLRRPDGVIVASLVERRRNAAAQVAGPVAQASDGSLRIGNLRLIGIDTSLVGRRAVLVGRLGTGGFFVSKSEDQLSLLHAHVEKLSLESYVARTNAGLQIGAGFALAGRGGSLLPEGRIVRAVIAATIEKNGTMHLDSLHADPHGSGADGDERDEPTNSQMHGETPSGAHGFGHGGQQPGNPPGPGRSGPQQRPDAFPGSGEHGFGAPNNMESPPGFGGPAGGPAGPGFPGSFGPGGLGGGMGGPGSGGRH